MTPSANNTRQAGQESRRNRPGRFGFIPLGIGGLFSSIHYSTSLLLFLGEKRLLIDCPQPLPKILHDASSKSGIVTTLEDVHHVILTHLHGDHSGGLETLGFYARFNSSRRATLWTLPEIARDLWNQRLSASMAYDLDNSFQVERRYGIEDFFDVRLLAVDQPASILGAEVHVRRTRHAPSCFGLKIFYGGRSMGYSSDTMFDPDHIAFLQECDLIIHETGRGIHTRYEALVALPEPVRRKIHLVHVDDDFDTAASQLPVLEEGRYYPLE